MRYSTFLFILICLFCLQEIKAQNSFIKGNITDQTTREPLAGASIYLKGTYSGVASDKNGAYIIKHLSPGTYKITVSYIGYIPQEKEVTIDTKKESLLVNFELKEQTNNLDEIVVTGTGTEHYLKDAPVQTEVITREALKQYAGRNLEDILNGLSPSFSFNANDMGSNMQLNGLGNDYILILINGKRMNGDIGGQNDLSRINPDMIERIEIVKGASSSLYGSDAIAGVVNIILRKNTDRVLLENTTRAGNYKDLNQSNLVGWSNGRLNSTTSAHVKHTDGWQNTTQEWRHHELREGTVSKTVNKSTNYSLSEILSYKVNPNLSLTGNATFYEKWTSRPKGPWKYVLYDFYYRNQSYAAGGKYNFSGKNYLTADISYDQYNYYYDYTGLETTDFFNKDGQRIIHYPGDRILQTSQHQWLGQLKGIFYLPASNTLSAGVEFQYDRLRSPYRMKDGEATVYTLSGYAQDEWNLIPNLNITAGVRMVQHKEFGQKLTPKISAKYKWGNFNLRGTYSHGFKAPNLKELYYSYITILMGPLKAYYGNEDLKPQSSNYYSANAEYLTDKFKFSVTGYFNRIKNMISLQPIATSPEDKLLEVQETMQYKNLANARSFGADVTFTYKPTRDFSLGGGYSYVDAKAQNTDDPDDFNFLKYTHINGTSYHHATFRASWKHKDSGISLFGKYQSKRYYLQDGNAKGFQVWRLNALHTFLKKKYWSLDVNAGIDNIFNYIDRTPFGKNRGTTTPGRTFYMAFTVKFQNKAK